MHSPGGAFCAGPTRRVVRHFGRTRAAGPDGNERTPSDTNAGADGAGCLRGPWPGNEGEAPEEASMEDASLRATAAIDTPRRAADQRRSLGSRATQRRLSVRGWSARIELDARREWGPAATPAPIFVLDPLHETCGGFSLSLCGLLRTGTRRALRPRRSRCRRSRWWHCPSPRRRAPSPCGSSRRA